jgi:uncharacterized protein involved in response to NO
MQVLERSKALAIPPLLRLAFRPFFLGGCLLALLAIPLWLAAFSGSIVNWQPAGGWLGWHRHELLFGFGLAIIAGFLLTAVQTWTSRPGLSGQPLAALAVVWLLARVAWLVNAPWAVLAILELAFPLAVAALMGFTLWKVRQKRNYPIVVVLILLAAADAVSLYGLLAGHEGWQRQGVLGGKDAVVPWAWLDWLLLIGSPLVAVLYAAGPALYANVWMGLLFAVLGVGHLIRLVRWHDRGLWQVPLLWSLHLAYGWLAVACLGMAAWHFGAPINPSLAVHCLTIGAMGGLVLAMIARVSLGHTGRPLEPPRGMTLAFILLNLGCLSRVGLVLLFPLAALWIAGACWALAFALYTWRYAPMLVRARVDGHPG